MPNDETEMISSDVVPMPSSMRIDSHWGFRTILTLAIIATPCPHQYYDTVIDSSWQLFSFRLGIHGNDTSHLHKTTTHQSLPTFMPGNTSKQDINKNFTDHVPFTPFLLAWRRWFKFNVLLSGVFRETIIRLASQLLVRSYLRLVWLIWKEVGK